MGGRGVLGGDDFFELAKRTSKRESMYTLPSRVSKSFASPVLSNNTCKDCGKTFAGNHKNQKPKLHSDPSIAVPNQIRHQSW